MIALPSRCEINLGIKIIVRSLSDEMVSWAVDVGGQASITQWYNRYGQKLSKPVIQFGRGKTSYNMQDGTENVLIHLRGEDTNIAMMFLLKFSDNIISHNMNDLLKYRV